MALKTKISNLITEFEKGENCLTWARAVGLGETKKDRDLISTMTTVDSNRLEDFDDNVRNPHEAHLVGRAAINILVDRLIMAYKFNLSGEFDEASDHIQEGLQDLESYVTSGSLPQSYLHGMKCAFKGAEIHQVIVKAKLESSELTKKIVSETLQEVIQLAQKTKADTREAETALIGLFVLKHFFFGRLSRSRTRECKDQLLSALTKLVDLEPKNYEWWYLLYKHHEQKRFADKSTNPRPEEKEALEKAVALLEESGQSDTDVDSSYMVYVASVLKSNSGVRSGKQFQLTFGNQTFNQREHAVNHLKQKVEFLLRNESHFTSSFIVAARVLGVLLPEEFRDQCCYRLAEKCCLKALERRPHCGKAFHQLGKTVAQQGNFKDAARYYLEAYELDKSAVFCMLDAVSAMMLDLEHFEDDLKKLFGEVHLNDSLRASEIQRNRLDFYKGIFYLTLNEDEVEGMKQLKTAFKTTEVPLITKFYGPMCWKLNLKKSQKVRIMAAMDKYYREHPSEVQDPKIRRLKSLLVVRRE